MTGGYPPKELVSAADLTVYHQWNLACGIPLGVDGNASVRAGILFLHVLDLQAVGVFVLLKVIQLCVLQHLVIELPSH